MSKIGVFTSVTLSKNGHGIVAHAIRATEIASALTGRGHDVELFGPPAKKAGYVGFARLFRQAARSKDVVILPFNLAQRVGRIGVPNDRCPVVVDMFDPALAGIIPSLPGGVLGDIEFERFRLNAEMGVRIGDYFICASNEQRLGTLGLLSAWGRINAHTYSSNIIGIVPTGVPACPADNIAGLFKGNIVPGNARLILWPGGVFTWYRPLPLLDAFHQIMTRVQNSYFVFVGTSNPAFEPTNPILRELRERANNLNTENRRIFFEPSLPYDQRARMYADADVGVCLFEQSIESELSFRTRLVDMLWGGLPIVTSAGSSLARTIHETGSGLALSSHEPPIVADALCRILLDDSLRMQMAANARRTARQFSWDHVIEPLAAFCEEPQPAEDRGKLPLTLLLSRRARWERQLKDIFLRLRRKLAVKRMRHG